MILKKLVVGPFAANCYIVGSELSKEGMVVDPGDEAEQILDSVRDLQLDIKYLVLTHGHIDHVSAVQGIKEATGAELCVHSGDSGLIKGRPLNSLFGLSSPTLPSPERWLEGGDSLDVGDLHFLVLHTPGHTPGGICLLGEGVVFTGDTLFNYSIGRADLPGGSYSQLLNSIQTKLMALPDNTVVHPGHGPETTVGAERQANPFLRG